MMARGWLRARSPAAAAAVIALLSVTACRRERPQREKAGPTHAPKAAPSVPPAARDPALLAYGGAVAALAREPFLSAEDTWLVQRALLIRPDAALEKVYARTMRMLLSAQDPASRLFNLGEPLRPPPAPAPRGSKTSRLYAINSSPFTKSPAATRTLWQFLSETHSGVLLCRQMVALGWAEQTGMALPKATASRRQILLKRIEDELKPAKSAGGLYAERAALLSIFGHPAMEAVEGWVQKLRTDQAPDGGWSDSTETPVELDGERIAWRFAPAHVTATAMTTLALYLKQRGL